MLQIGRRKKAQKHTAKELWETETGLHILSPRDPGMNPAASCFFRGLLIFCCLFGTVGCYTSSFEIPFDAVLTGGFLLLVSLYAAFLYYNRVTLNVGYLLLLLLFAGAAFRFHQYAGSGFNAIINITYDAIDEKYALPAVRHFPEAFTDRYTSVTVSLLFIGTFFAILLNCLLSGSRRFLKVFLCTFPVILIGLYFDKMPSMPYVLLTVCGLGSTLVLKKGSRRPLNGAGKKRKQNTFHHRYHNGNHFSSVGGTGHLSIAATCSLFAGAVLLLTSLLLPQSFFTTPAGFRVLRNYTDTYVRTFMISGFSGFMNRYDAAGGVSGGKLGGISSIRPDFETDLLVELVPYQEGSVYLKAFTAGNYRGNHWEPSVLLWDSHDTVETSADAELTANRESSELAKQFEVSNPGAMKSKMRITNKGANPSYPYLPYYTSSSLKNDSPFNITGYKMGVSLGSSPLNIPYEVIYYPYSFRYSDFPSSESLINDLIAAKAYLQLPGSVKPALAEFCIQNGLFDSSLDAMELAEKINDCFSAPPFSYSMNPGATPKNKDFVLWFLLNQKKGFCTHFASAATLIFRLNGIPARYVEGYSIPYRKILDSDLIKDERYEDWFWGTSPLGKTAVVETEVNDSMAHAWVEVYKEGYGWFPVEVTPPSGAEEETGSSFWDLFTGVFSGAAPSSDGNSQTLADFNKNLTAAFQNAGGVFIFLLALSLFLFLLFYVYRILSRPLALYWLMRSGRYNEAVMYDYRLLIRQLYKKHYLPELNLTCRTCFSEIRDSLKPQEEDMEKWALLVEKAGYSPRRLSAEEAGFCCCFTRSLLKLARKRH